jgi:hypothetical protein
MMYRRFLDLQKAEAQTREAHIEAALERVRSRSMAMHKSEEIQQVVAELFKQMQPLGLARDGCELILCNEETGQMEYWHTNPLQSDLPESYNVSKSIDPFFEKQWAAWQDGVPSLVIKIEGEEKREIDTLILERTDFRKIPEDTKQWIRSVEKSVFSLVTIKYGLLEAIDVEPLSQENFLILHRFARVFEQTYTRFLDLKRAEAQAREAQIEAALERVRSRSMAMHSSDELLNVINVVSEQLQQLGLKFNTVSFAINNKKHDYSFWFAAMGDSNPAYVQVPYLNNPMYDRMKEVLASGVDYYADTLTPEESRQWHEHLFAHAKLPNLSDDTRAYILRSGYARSIAIMPSILLIVSNYAARSYSEAENDIIKRFAAVFQQSYTRFLDLQKAEGQAREAQIEVALERVRARTMAMHKSEELRDAVNVMYKEMEPLGLSQFSTTLHLMDDEKDRMEIWMAAAVNPEYEQSFFWNGSKEQPSINKVWAAWRKKLPFAQIHVKDEEKQALDDYLFERTDYKKP